MLETKVTELVLYWNGSVISPEFWTHYDESNPGLLTKVIIHPVPLPPQSSTRHGEVDRVIKDINSKSKRLSKEFKKLQKVLSPK